MATIGTINIVLSASTSDFEAALKQAVKTTKSFGRDLEDFGKVATAAITVPLAGIGTAAVAAALKIDDAMDQIRASTGAMGADMKQLGDDLRAVVGTVPNDIEQVADAISGLNQRLGLAGEPLQAMATQMLNLAEITKTDVGPLIESTTRVFASFGIAAEDQAGSLDVMFRATQQSGIGIQKLSDLVVQFGPSMRALGLSFNDTVAYIAAFERSGVNTEKAMMGMNTALKTFAKAGVADVGAALQGVIQHIKDTATQSEATAAAIKVFGAKAGPELADAIRSGRMEIGEFLTKIREGPDTINKAAEANRGFAEQVKIMRERVTEALEPIGIRLVQAFEQMLPTLIKLIDQVAKMAEWFGNLSPMAQQMGLAIAGIAAAIGPVTLAVGGMVKGFAGLAGVMGGAGGIMGLATALGPVLIALGAAFVAIKVTGFVQDLMNAQQKMKEFKDNVGRMALELKMKFGLEIKQGVGESLEDFEKRLSYAWNEAERFSKQVDQIPQSMRGARVAVDETKTGLEKYTVSMGGVSTATSQTKTDMSALTGEASKQTKEIDNLRQAFEKASAPMNALAANYAQLEKAGVKFDDILKANADEIFKATQTQLSHGQALSATALKYAEAAAAIKNTEQSVKAFDTVMTSFAERARTELAASAKAIADTADNFEKEAERIAKSMDFAEAVERSQNNVKDMLDAAGNYYVVSEERLKTFHDLVRVGVPIEKAKSDISDLEKTWMQSVSTMVTDWAKATTDMIFEGKDFFGTMKNIVVEFGKTMVRGLLESVAAPMQGMFKDIGGLMTSGLKGIFGGDGGGGIMDTIKGLGGKLAGGLKGMFGGLFGGGGGGGDWAGEAAGAVSSGIKGIFGKALGFLGGPWGAAAMAGTALIPLVKGLFSKSSITKAIDEAARDLGGVKVGKEAMQQFMSAVGLDEKGLSGIRKDIAVSPKFLVDIAAPMAEAQGKTEAFLKSLENIGTAWGTFNFREAFQIGELTGDFTMLNEAFVEAFSKSQNLQAALPNFAEVLAATGKEANGLYTELMEMGQQFTETGVMTDEFASKVTDLGGNMEIFQAAAELPGLKGALATFTDLKAQVDEFLPKQQDMNQGFIETGVVSGEMAKQIEMAGGNLEVFQEFAEVKAARDSLDDLVNKFKETGVVSEELTRIIQTFGSEGVKSMEITADSIDHVADIMEWDLGGAMRNAANTLSLELEKMNRTLEEQIGFLTEAIVRSMNAMVYAMAGMPEKAREIMDQLNADFEAFKPKVEVEVVVDDVQMGETVDQIEAAIPEILTAEVQVTANTTAVTQALAATQQQINQMQAAAAAPAMPAGNPFDAAINKSGGLPTTTRSVYFDPKSIATSTVGAYGPGSYMYKDMKDYYEAMGWAWEQPEEELFVKGAGPGPGTDPDAWTTGRQYQHGGLVGETGPAILHAGERVIPAGQGQGTPITVNLNPQIAIDVQGSEQTGQDVAKELARLLPGILERNARGFATKIKRELGLPNYGGAV
jgi:TP901 family phage tail tape measure protein